MSIWRTSRVVAVFLSCALATQVGISARPEEVEAPIQGVEVETTTSLVTRPSITTTALGTTTTQLTTTTLATSTTASSTTTLTTTELVTTIPEVVIRVTEPQVLATPEVTEPVTELETQVVTETVTDIITEAVIVDDSQIPENEVELIAKLCAGEAGHLPDDEHRFIIWTVFNRVNEGRWGGSTVLDVLYAPNQFLGITGGNNWRVGSDDYRNHLRQLVREEYQKWLNGECCPACTYAKAGAEHGYNSFYGDGSHNWFRKS